MSERKRILGVVLSVVILATSVGVAPAAMARSPELPTVKVKCVAKSTGFARYAKAGVCKRTERIDRKPCAKGGSCVVGDTGPGRGKIFYSARTAQPWGRYLEVAPAAWMSGGDPNLIWCDIVDQPVAGTEGTGLGAGKANTAAMLALCTTDSAVAASAYRGGGKADWYLPARDELRALFLRQKITGGFQLHGYWSSSQESPNMAWIQDFYGEYTPAPSDKSFANYVRPIRSF